MNDVKRWHGYGHDNTPKDFVTMLASDYDALVQQLAEASKERDEAKANGVAHAWRADAARAELTACKASLSEARAALERAETVLANMALENEGAIFNRWPISHEPLRSDARNVLPIVRAALAIKPSDAKEGT